MMKKIFILLLLLFISLTSFSQRAAEFKNGITIQKEEVLASKFVSYGESYITNWRNLVLDDGATYFPNNGGYEIGRLHQAGIIPSLHFIPAAVGEGIIYAIGKNRVNDLDVSNSASTYVDEDGIIQTAPIDFARIDYTDGDGAFLFEPQSTNLYLNSDVMVTQNVTTTAVLTTVSFYGTGTITFTGTHTASLVGTGIDDRVSLTFTPSAGTLTNTISGTVTNGQLEKLGYATSFVLTAGVSTTRLADVINGAGSSDTFNDSEGVLYVEMAALADDGTDRIFGLSNGASFNDSVMIRYSSDSNIVSAHVRLAGVYQCFLNYTLSNSTEFSKIAFKYKLNDFSLWVDGIERDTDVNGGIITGLDGIGFSFVSGNLFFGKIRQLKVYKSISEAQLDLPYITNFFPLLLIGFRRRNQFKIAA